jgi:hypothetical protein
VQELIAVAGTPRAVPLSESALPCIIEISECQGASLVCATLSNADRLPTATLCLAVREMYKTVLHALRSTRSPHLVRMWNFVPGIHARMGADLDRYRVFNIGRYDALSQWFGGAVEFGRVLPAASAVGHSGHHLSIHALGSSIPGIPFENPRQSAAFDYSHAHGPRPPCFARATLAHLPTGVQLLVSGTASIRGEDSVHFNSLSEQFDETIETIELLARSVRGEHRFDPAGIRTARVYHLRKADLPWLVEHTTARLPADARVEYIQADICRAELLVEIEATIAPSAPSAS